MTNQGPREGRPEYLRLLELAGSDRAKATPDGPAPWERSRAAPAPAPATPNDQEPWWFEGPYGRYPTTVLETDLSEHAKIIYLVLTSYVARNGNAWPSVDSIARRASVGRRTAQRALIELADEGWIEREQRPVEGRRNQTTLYRLRDPHPDHSKPVR